MKLILLGAPGAGKGTIAKLLSGVDGSVQISTGDILRGEVEAGSELGARARGYMQRGELVPDELIMEMMEGRLQRPDCAAGFLLDGFPRTIPQAEALAQLLQKLGIALDMVVNLDAPREVILERLTTRRTCENPDCQAIYNIRSKPPRVEGVCDRCGGAVVQRADESEEAITQRLETYMEKTAPLTDYYLKQGLLLRVDATSSEKAVAAVREKLQHFPYWGVGTCGGGWMCIGLKAGCGYDCFTSSTIRDAVAELRRRDAKIALCTVPIGLPDGREKRRCDILAREFLGCRRNSVFPIPCRRAVEAYREADGGKNEKKQAGRDVSYAVTKKVLPNQSWDLAPHIIELDEFLFEDPDARGLFRETHAEICFRGLNGNELLTSKKQREGVQKRRELLQEYFPQAEHVYENARSCPGVVANSEISMTNSNILDVLAAALTAKLGADGDTPYRSLGSETKDSRGLPMQMLYVDPREKIRARSKQ